MSLDKTVKERKTEMTYVVIREWTDEKGWIHQMEIPLKTFLREHDFEAVVRCKDCTSLYDGWCIDYGIHMDDNEFCSGGERRQTDETD